MKNVKILHKTKVRKLERQLLSQPSFIFLIVLLVESPGTN